MAKRRKPKEKKGKVKTVKLKYFDIVFGPVGRALTKIINMFISIDANTAMTPLRNEIVKHVEDYEVLRKMVNADLEKDHPDIPAPKAGEKESKKQTEKRIERAHKRADFLNEKMTELNDKEIEVIKHTAKITQEDLEDAMDREIDREKKSTEAKPYEAVLITANDQAVLTDKGFIEIV